MALPGVLAFLRFLVFYFDGQASGHIQSLVIGAALIAAGAVTMMGGLLADLIFANRLLLAEIRGKLLASELQKPVLSPLTQTTTEPSQA